MIASASKPKKKPAGDANIYKTLESN